MSSTFKCGWYISDQAAVIPGLGIGPKEVRGSGRCGEIGEFKFLHNLIGKDIIFHAKGKHALGMIVEQMKKRNLVRACCGIRPGMKIEKFVASPYGGGDDQVIEEAGKDDIVRMPYYLYAFPEEASPFSFNGLLMNFTSQAIGFIPASAGVAGIAFRDVMDSALTAKDKLSSLASHSKSSLAKAMTSSKVIVLVTGKRRGDMKYVSVHKHSHSMATLAKDIIHGVMRGG